MNYLEFGVLQVSLSCSDSMPPRYFIARPRVPCIFALPCCLPKFSSSSRSGCPRGASDFFNKSVKKVRKKFGGNDGKLYLCAPNRGESSGWDGKKFIGEMGKAGRYSRGGVVPRAIRPRRLVLETSRIRV